MVSLPAEATVTVSALSTGSLTLPEHFFILPCDPSARRTVPSLSFLVQHTDTETQKTTRILFDLRIRRDISAYCYLIRKHRRTRQPISTSPDVVASLGKGALTPDDIDLVLLPHVHWDHVGMPSDFSNPKTYFIVGPGALDLLNGSSKLWNGSHCIFKPDLLDLNRTVELPPLDGVASNVRQPQSDFKTEARLPRSDDGEIMKLPNWRPFSIFPATIDFFSGGSLYTVHAPGHLPGHINILARISSSHSSSTHSPQYIYLAGDAFHDRRIYTCERSVAEWVDDAYDAGTGAREDRVCCIDADKAAAEGTIERIRRLGMGADQKLGKVEVVFAHDAEWDKTAIALGRFWPGKV